MLTRNTPQHCKCNPRASRRGHRFCFSNATVLCVRSKSSLFLLSIFVQFCKVERSIRVELTVHLSVFGGGWGGGVRERAARQEQMARQISRSAWLAPFPPSSYWLQAEGTKGSQGGRCRHSHSTPLSHLWPSPQFEISVQ